MTRENFTAIAVVIDASSSMRDLTGDTIGSFNQFLEEQQAVPGEAALTLCIFNTDYRLLHDFIPLSSVGKLSKETYRCNGMTALLDAMGTTIDALGQKLAVMPEQERPSKVIVLVITDGEENQSHRFNLEQIKEKITHQREVYSWEFVFMGANIDAIGAGTSLGITAANSLQYDATSVGTRSLYSSVSSNMSSYRLASNRSQVDFFNQQPAPPVDVTVTKTDVVNTPVSTPAPVITTFDPGHPFPTTGQK